MLKISPQHSSPPPDTCANNFAGVEDPRLHQRNSKKMLLNIKMLLNTNCVYFKQTRDLKSSLHIEEKFSSGHNSFMNVSKLVLLFYNCILLCHCPDCLDSWLFMADMLGTALAQRNITTGLFKEYHNCDKHLKK
jgi:hypothetical protein